MIANSVGGEGANLQRRTCAVHNVDLPWDPMTRRQRNGRADRQGNELDAIVSSCRLASFGGCRLGCPLRRSRHGCPFGSRRLGG
jgi:hypothetical protein